MPAPDVTTPAPRAKKGDPLRAFHEPVREWFSASFEAPTRAQALGWAKITEGSSTLLLAPTGSGKTLAAFLAAIDRIMFSPEPANDERLGLIYVSPLKALAVDIERNLRAPIAGIAAVAGRRGVPVRIPEIAVRSGDTPARERARFRRHPPDILITTPESLYLMLTSEARERLVTARSVIVDEIHAVAGTKRGAHLFLSLERLEALRSATVGSPAPPLQRIGLSATQRPLEEIARLLGGFEEPARPRPVEIVDAGSKRAIEVTVEVPVEDMARLAATAPLAANGFTSGPAGAEPEERATSIWPSIYPRLVELIRAHRSTMIFVNSRRLAERLSSALNEVAGEELALAHHGSVAHDARKDIEDRLKAGTLPAIVATSSLELGIDMGAVDLVVQIEAPPSVASGMQRIGRAGHHVGGVSRGVIFPKFRGDLLACAAAAKNMGEGAVEETFYPKSPLDVLAQHIVAHVSAGPIRVDALFDLVRRAAPFAELPIASFEGVLDMLSGRYPSDEFAELRPRVTWDRVAGVLTPRQGARHIAIVNGGTIPDRGLYGVFLAGTEEGKPVRVGELDEEMVFESREGEVFLLGASAWRIVDITHDRVLVQPAPGEPGKMPFWHGDRPGRPAAFGRAIGALTRKLEGKSPAEARALLTAEHGLEPRAADNLVQYLADQRAATGEVPSDKTIVVERFKDEVGDWRVCLLSPFGARVHAPWAMAVTTRFREERGAEIETIWSDDGIVFRIPEAESPPDVASFFIAPDEVEGRLVESVGHGALFASRFRENAGRALLLPRRRPGQRTPLWAQRKRAADLLSVASRYGAFPILLETYRECLRDVFDLPALVDVLGQVASRGIRMVAVDSKTPSPFASSLLFSYVANFIYDGDAPLAERRAQALSIDHAQLRELLGEAELRELLDPDAIVAVERSLGRLDRPARHADGLHDLLLGLGDLTREEIELRCDPPEAARTWLEELEKSRRVIAVTIASEPRFAAVEDAARLRDALGIVPPRGLPVSLLEPTKDPLVDLVSRYARTHGPFFQDDVARRLGLGVAPVKTALGQLEQAGRVVSGGFTPGRRGVEWVDAEVLRTLKRKSLAKLRKEVEPVDPTALARFLVAWHDVARPRGGQDALFSAIERLEGAPLPASALVSDILPARVRGFTPGDLDALCASGDVLWRGLEPNGPQDGRIALYLADQYRLLAPPVVEAEAEPAPAIRALLRARGALFFHDIVAGVGTFGGDVLTALWDLVWAGEVTNDTLLPLRSLYDGSAARSASPHRRGGASGRAVFRSRRAGPPGSEGRWSLLPRPDLEPSPPTPTERATALCHVLLERHGVLTKEAVAAEGVAGGFAAVYPVLKAMEEAGRVRRGYFIAGLGAAQFARAGADDRIRAVRDTTDAPLAIVLGATDPANPYGAALPWPAGEPRPQRVAGAQVVLFGGALIGYLGRGERHVLSYLPEREPERSEAARALATALAGQVDGVTRKAMLIGKIDGDEPGRAALAPFLLAAGFSPSRQGFLGRPPR